MINLQSRVKNILTQPAQEWPVIAAEPTTVEGLYKQYIMPLAAIPAVCSFIGMSFIGISMPFIGGRIRTPIVSGIVSLIVTYALTLAGVYVCAIIIEKLAPKFKSSGTTIDALKLVAYASTATWVAGVFQLIPALGVLVLLAALYGIYLFYLGLPIIMKTPSDQVIPYMVVSAIVMIVVFIVIGMVVGLTTAGGYGSMYM